MTDDLIARLKAHADKHYLIPESTSAKLLREAASALEEEHDALQEALGVNSDMTRELARHAADLEAAASLPPQGMDAAKALGLLEQWKAEDALLPPEPLALREPPQEPWQLIETYGDRSDYVLLNSSAHGRVIGAHVTGDVWHFIGVGCVTSESERPTHWLPLPSPPASAPAPQQLKSTKPSDVLGDMDSVGPLTRVPGKPAAAPAPKEEA